MTDFYHIADDHGIKSSAWDEFVLCVLCRRTVLAAFSVDLQPSLNKSASALETVIVIADVVPSDRIATGAASRESRGQRQQTAANARSAGRL